MTRKTEGVAMTRRVRKAVKSGAGAGTQLLSPPRRENEETGPWFLSAGPGQDS